MRWFVLYLASTIRFDVGGALLPEACHGQVGAIEGIYPSRIEATPSLP